jgi:hypothetical protein
MITVRFSDGTTAEFPPATPLADVLHGAAKGGRPIAAVLDGRTVGLDARLPAAGSVAVEPLRAGDPRALPVMRHSAAHVMARAVMRLFEGVELAFGPTVGEGFYYDLRAARPITDEDLPAIEAEMKRIIEADEATCRRYAESSPSLVTALVPLIGYEAAAAAAHRAVTERRTIRDVVLEDDQGRETPARFVVGDSLPIVGRPLSLLSAGQLMHAYHGLSLWLAASR